MRFIALDVHRDFCEVAIKDKSGLRLAGRVKSSVSELELFRAESRARRRGRAGGDRSGAGDRSDSRRPRRTRPGRQHAQALSDRRVQGQDRQGRR